jgi:thiol-disulfide isomerase/thioredoxin
MNSEKIESIESLEGKVVLVDFWTYSCINCIRTFPYLQDLQEKYADKGLVILGIHSPEFAFEKKPENVAGALKKYGLTCPVALDNDFKT